jgi:hypothetical protein
MDYSMQRSWRATDQRLKENSGQSLREKETGLAPPWNLFSVNFDTKFLFKI